MVAFQILALRSCHEDLICRGTVRDPYQVELAEKKKEKEREEYTQKLSAIWRLSRFEKIASHVRAKITLYGNGNQHFSARRRACGPDATSVCSYLRPNPLPHNGPIHQGIRCTCAVFCSPTVNACIVLDFAHVLAPRD